MDETWPLLRNWLVNHLFHLPIALGAVVFYGFPANNLKVIGVTGTDGKTTTSTLIYEILKRAGKKTALISTVSAKIGKSDLPTGLHVTTPNPWEMQRLLKLIADKNYQYVVIESTSHGLDQFRLLGCNFYLGVMTNITHEHLDYHKTLKNYLQAKAKLFKKTKINILNKDDKSYRYLKSSIPGKIVTYALHKADYTPKNFPFITKLIGDYNQYNCLAAIAATKVLGISDQVIRQTIRNFSGVIGRMDEIINKKQIRIFVDFAHTPNGLLNALKTLKRLDPKKLIAVFGTAGLRDHSKRPKMGQIACDLADRVILTAEDPRTENVLTIINEIKKGCRRQNKIIIEPDRQKAIDIAINQIARKGDLVGIFGKGHEKSMCFGTKELPWSDHQAVNKALSERNYV